MRNKKLVSLVLAAALLATGCGKTGDTNPDTTPTTAPTTAVTQGAENGNTTPIGTPTPKPIEEKHGDIRTEFNDSLDLSDYPLTANDIPSDFVLKMEAEDAEVTGNCETHTSSDYSGGGYASLKGTSDGTITFNVDLDYSGFYDLNFVSHSGDHGRQNNVSIDGVTSGSITCNSDGAIVDSYLSNLYIEAGSHAITISAYWGYTDFDCLIMTRSDAITEDTYNITTPLSNPNADDNTKRLYNFLCDIYGKYSLTGQFADLGRVSLEWSEIENATGKNFAVLGMDMMDYGLTNRANGANGKTLGYAYDFYTNAGGIVQLCWHWAAPTEYVIDDAANNHYWWNSFYKENTTLDLDKIMNGEDETAHQLLIDDMNNIATEFERLRDAGVPVIWRPLHEASGGWFWWGDCSAESNIKLWQEMYDIFTNQHNLTNIIWMWNGQDPDWYPGDEYVDIVSTDIYQGEHVYTSYAGTFTETATIATSPKLVALSENGTVMDPDLVMKDNARWLFWGTWAQPYTLKDGLFLSEEYTEKDMLIKAYNHDRTLTLDELPDLKNYRLD